MTNTLARQRQIVGPTADWAAHDLVLGDGELALERQDDGAVFARVGDGSTPFSAAPYLTTQVAALRYIGNADPTAPPPAGASPGDAYTASPGGVVNAAWGPPAAGQTVDEGDFLVMGADGSWNVQSGGIDASAFVTEAELGAATGAGMSGFDPTVTYAPDTLGAAVANFPVPQQFGVVGDGVTNDHAAFQAAIHFARDNGIKLVVPDGDYLVGSLQFDGSGYEIATTAKSRFKQLPGLTGDSQVHPIWNVTGSDIKFGSASFEGNIATDVAEYSHAVIFSSCKDVSAGVLHGKNLRGDVVYIYGRNSSEADRTRGLRIAGITGDNVLRCILAVAGGEANVGFVRRVGSMQVGYKDVDVEPNDVAGTIDDYQAVRLAVGDFLGAQVQVVSADADVVNLAVEFGTMDLDGSRIANSVPPYSGFAGANDFALSVYNTQKFAGGKMTVRNYQYSPIALGSKVGLFDFDELDFANVSLALALKRGAKLPPDLVNRDAVYNTLFLHLGTDRPGLVRGGLVKGVLSANTKMIFRSDVAFLNLAVERVDVVGGSFGARLTGRIGTLKLDAGNTGNVVFNALAGMTFGSVVVTNSAASIGFAGSANVIFHDTVATFGTLDYSGAPSSDIIAINSAINGPLVPGVNLLIGGSFAVGGIKVVGAQMAAIADIGAAPTAAQYNALLNVFRTHGLIRA